GNLQLPLRRLLRRRPRRHGGHAGGRSLGIYFSSEPSTPRRIEPPFFISTLVASRTTTLVTVRVAVLAMVVPIESLRRAVVLGGLGEGCGRCAGPGSLCGTRECPHGSVEPGPGSTGGGASYWPRRLGPAVGRPPLCSTLPPIARAARTSEAASPSAVRSDLPASGPALLSPHPSAARAG